MRPTLPTARALIRLLRQQKTSPRSTRNRRPFLRILARRVIRQAGREAAVESVYPLIENLWKSEDVAARHLALHILEGFRDGLNASTWKMADGWIDSLDQPSLTDALASRVLGPVLARERSFLRALECWARSRNLWRRRAALEAVRSLACIRQAYVPEIITLGRILSHDPEPLVQRSLGRALGECARLAPTPVRQFLLIHRKSLSAVVQREVARGLPPSTN